MSAAQLDIFADHLPWVERDRYIARLIHATAETGHLREPEYSLGSLSWPTLRRWKSGAVLWGQVPDQPIAAYLQTHDGRTRYLLVDLAGYVIAEGAWCTTTGGARGWLGRSTEAWS